MVLIERASRELSNGGLLIVNIDYFDIIWCEFGCEPEFGRVMHKVVAFLAQTILKKSSNEDTSTTNR